MKLKQYIITEEVIENLRREKVPDKVLQSSAIKDVRFRSPKDFREALKTEITKKELKVWPKVIEMPLITGSGTKFRSPFRMKLELRFRELSEYAVFIKQQTGDLIRQQFLSIPENLPSLYGGKNILTHEIAILLNDIENADICKRET